jgi:hypothetical protein
MTTTSDLDLSKITQAINSLKQQLPPDSELAQSLTQQTLLWMTTVQGVKAWLALQQCLQLIETEEQKATLSPVLRQNQKTLFHKPLIWNPKLYHLPQSHCRLLNQRLNPLSRLMRFRKNQLNRKKPVKNGD